MPGFEVSESENTQLLPKVARQRTSTDAVGRQPRSALARPQFWFGLAVLVPIMAWYAVLAGWPIAHAFYISLHQWNALNPSASSFVGLQNYAQLPQDELFKISLVNSFSYVAMLALGVIPLALFLAIVLDRIIRGRQLYLFFIYSPAIMSVVAISFLFSWFYDPTYGLFNYALRALNLPPQSFLFSPEQALPSIAAMSVWQSVGFYTVIFS